MRNAANVGVAIAWMASALALSACSNASGFSYPKLPGLGDPAPSAMTPAQQSDAIKDLNAAKAQNEAQAGAADAGAADAGTTGTSVTPAAAAASGTAPVEPVQQQNVLAQPATAAGASP